jgi:hypothetical protein
VKRSETRLEAGRDDGFRFTHPLVLRGTHLLRGLRELLLTLAAASLLTPWAQAQEPGPFVGPPEPSTTADEAPSVPENDKPESAPLPIPPPASEEKKTEPAPVPPVYLFLNAATDLNDLIAKLSKPDFVLVDWVKYQTLQEKAEAAMKVGESATNVINSVALNGELDNDRASLEVEYRIISAGEGPRRVPIGLDGQVIGSATEEGRPVLVETAPEGGWAVELEGKGEHRILVRLHPPVRSTSEGSRLDLSIPEAASTRLDLRTRPSVIEARLGSEESVPVVPDPDGEGSVLRAYVSPRSRLELSWRTRAVEGPSGPALLTAQGEIAIEVQRGVLQARATFEVRSERGSARSLGIKLDPEDELLALEIDGRSAAVETSRGEKSSVFKVSLPDPVRPDEPHKVLVAVRRALSSGTGPTLVTFRGFPLEGVAAQSGLIAVSQSGGLWVSGTPGRSLRQVDPRSDLPPSLRVQPSYVLAYQFLDQPFELALQVDPSPPWVRVDSKATISLSGRESRVDQRLEYRISRGRLFQLRIAMPPGLSLDSVGPDTVFESAEVLPASPDDDGAGETLVLPLSQSAREKATFTLRLEGTQRIDPSKPVEAGLFRPLDASWRGGSVAVLTARDLSVDLGRTKTVWPSNAEVPASWPWPTERLSSRAVPSLWLQHGGDIETIPLKIITHERIFEHTSTLDVVVDRHRIDYRQDVDSRVHFGTVDQLDLAVPPALDKWELEGADLSRRERIGVLESGEVHYRLTLARDLADRFRLKFRARQERDQDTDGSEPGRLTLEPIRILDGSSDPSTIRVSSAPGIELVPESDGWSQPQPGHSASPGLEESPPVQWVWTGTPGPDAQARIAIRAQQVAPLPSTVASRVWLRSDLASDGSVRTTASYRLDQHEDSVSVALPEGAQWIRARAGNDAIPEVEKRPESSSYRLRFPAQVPSGPIVLALEYIEPASSRSRAWSAPRLLDGAVVQQTFWEVRLPLSIALLGVPQDWTDENQWYWDLYVWKRRPRLGVQALMRWVAEIPGRTPGAVAEAADSQSHAYLFSTAGQPASIRPTLVARPWLVAWFSGSVLLVGLVLLARRPPAPLVMVSALFSALALGAAVEPSLLFLGIQSSVFGLVLVLVAALLRRSTNRRQVPGSVVRDRPRDSSHPVAVSVGSPTPSPDLAGSDGSTIIRPREGTTIEHRRKPEPPVPEPVEEHGRSG